MSPSDRRAAVCALALLAAGCVGSRRVDLRFHTPSMCTQDGRETGAPPDCPLGEVVAVRTVLERVDGTIEEDECLPVPEGLCVLDDFDEFLFVPRAPPADGVEVRLSGWTEPMCRGVLALSCETFGTGVIDLGSEDVIPIWCDCPYVTPP